MQAIYVTEFNDYILANRFIIGNEIAWFKNNHKPVSRVAVIIESDVGFEAVIYKRLHDNTIFGLDQFQKFESKELAYDFLAKELK
jgi:hypothetical protein